MLDHISIGVGDLRRSAEFYDAVLGALGYVRVFESAIAVGYASPGERDDPFAIRQDDEGHAGARRQFHVAFAAPDRECVIRFYDTALEHGATPDGEPGLHPEYGAGYFAAFVLDPDGYRIEAVLHE